MQFVITGATGFVGRNLVPKLEGHGIGLLLVGRDPVRIRTVFPGREACDYAGIADRGRGADVLIHMAALNNDADADDATFEAVNVQLFRDVVEMAKRARVDRVVNVSSAHALDPVRSDAYSRTKRAAAAIAEHETAIAITNVYLPAVHGDAYAGKLSALNRLPKPAAELLFGALSALKPTVSVERLADFLATIPGGETGPRHPVVSDGQDRNPLYRTVSRLTDLLAGLTILFGLWWLLIGLWVAVRATSPGPGIFAQERVGRGGALFTCYKFRTMRAGTRQGGTHEISAAAVTGVGRFLRRTKLDELPQAVNLLRGEISLVGPRPCLPVQRELVEARRELDVLRMRPGITGLAQINDIDMSTPRLLAEWDARYIALRSIVLDLKIVVMTVLGRGRGDRVTTSNASRGDGV